MDISFSHQQLWVADKEGNLQLYDASLGQFKHIKASSIYLSSKILQDFIKSLTCILMIVPYQDNCMQCNHYIKH